MMRNDNNRCEYERLFVLQPNFQLLADEITGMIFTTAGTWENKEKTALPYRVRKCVAKR